MKLWELLQSSYKSTPQLQAIIIPSSDAHQSEYLAECDKKREYISGFTGSAGTAVVTLNKAALWTDGRYFLQAEKELDDNWMLMKAGEKGTPEISEWLNDVLPDYSTVGCNPAVYSSGAWCDLRDCLQSDGHMLEPTSVDFVDEIWIEQPHKPSTPIIALDPKVAGLTISQKVEELREKMVYKKVKWLAVTALDEISWLFNMRAADIQYNPVFFAYAVVGLSSLHIFIDCKRVTKEIREHIGHFTTLHSYDDMLPFLETTCAQEKTWIGKNSSYGIMSAIPRAMRVMTIDNPVAVMKAFKNDNEIEGMKKCNINDAVALCRFFEWMEKEMSHGKTVTECSAAAKSLAFRKDEEGFVSLSFETISSSGPSGSIIHYTPTLDDDKPVLKNQIYLIDSGAQYKSGTTDTTRTVHFGEPSQYEKECFTRVLKGHIGLASILFPSRTKGYMLDTMARMHLWKVGLDYKHGTGHGVGSFLNVHEGPIGLYIGNSPRITKIADDVDLKEGLVITNEPGYYEDGKFGIRIENAMLCVKANTKYNFNEQQFYGFETIALVPIQHKLIEKSILSEEEIAWLNTYHTKVRKVIGAELKSRGYPETYQWLLKQTQPLDVSPQVKRECC